MGNHTEILQTSFHFRPEHQPRSGKQRRIYIGMRVWGIFLPSPGLKFNPIAREVMTSKYSVQISGH